MRGTIQKKGNKWYAVVYDGVNPATGNYRRRWVQAGTRRSDAEKLLAELVKRAHRGETVVSEKLTLGEYLTERWLPVQETRLRRSTYESYRRNVELHVVPGLGRRRLDQLTPEDIDLFYAALLKSGRKKRPGEKGPAKGLAPKTVHNIHVMLNKALSDAARKGTVVRNVVALADAPSLQAGKRPEVKAWEVDQLVAFLDAIQSHRMAPAYSLAAHTGMRRGEVLGLRWRDIDLGDGRVSVQQALVSVNVACRVMSGPDKGLYRREYTAQSIAIRALSNRNGRLDLIDGVVGNHVSDNVDWEVQVKKPGCRASSPEEANCRIDIVVDGVSIIEVKEYHGPQTTVEVTLQLAGYTDGLPWSLNSELSGWADFFVEEFNCGFFGCKQQTWIVWGAQAGHVYYARIEQAPSWAKDQAASKAQVNPWTGKRSSDAPLDSFLGGTGLPAAPSVMRAPVLV
jgi:integrase